jgi:hypothetical protein
MAEQRKSGGQRGRRRSSNNHMTGREAIERVRTEIADVLGRPIEAVLGLESGEDSTWTVTVQVVELERIPHSTDVLGSYAVTLDSDGELTGCRRQRRYYRNQADED